MTTLLHIEASPRKAHSFSTTAADAFIAAFRETDPTATIDTIDVWNEPLPPFNGDTLQAKYAVMTAKTFTDDQKRAWDAVTAMADRFKAADKILISAPMWNFGIPYPLKQYLDVILQPGLTFGWSPERGYFGLVTGKPAQVIVASMGDYAPGTDAAAIDYATPYLEFILKFIGFADVRTLRIPSTSGIASADHPAVQSAMGQARAAGAAF
jgi:FMN-dependent NADH-azoreductase